MEASDVKETIHQFLKKELKKAKSMQHKLNRFMPPEANLFSFRWEYQYRRMRYKGYLACLKWQKLGKMMMLLPGPLEPVENQFNECRSGVVVGPFYMRLKLYCSPCIVVGTVGIPSNNDPFGHVDSGFQFYQTIIDIEDPNCTLESLIGLICDQTGINVDVAEFKFLYEGNCCLSKAVGASLLSTFRQGPGNSLSGSTISLFPCENLSTDSFDHFSRDTQMDIRSVGADVDRARKSITRLGKLQLHLENMLSLL